MSGRLFRLGASSEWTILAPGVRVHLTGRGDGGPVVEIQADWGAAASDITGWADVIARGPGEEGDGRVLGLGLSYVCIEIGPAVRR